MKDLNSPERELPMELVSSLQRAMGVSRGHQRCGTGTHLRARGKAPRPPLGSGTRSIGATHRHIISFQAEILHALMGGMGLFVHQTVCRVGRSRELVPRTACTKANGNTCGNVQGKFIEVAMLVQAT